MTKYGATYPKKPAQPSIGHHPACPSNPINFDQTFAPAAPLPPPSNSFPSHHKRSTTSSSNPIPTAAPARACIQAGSSKISTHKSSLCLCASVVEFFPPLVPIIKTKGCPSSTPNRCPHPPPPAQATSAASFVSKCQ